MDAHPRATEPVRPGWRSGGCGTRKGGSPLLTDPFRRSQRDHSLVTHAHMETHTLYILLFYPRRQEQLPLSHTHWANINTPTSCLIGVGPWKLAMFPSFRVRNHQFVSRNSAGRHASWRTTPSAAVLCQTFLCIALQRYLLMLAC